MSPDRLLLPKRPAAARLIDGNLDAWMQARLDEAYELGKAEAIVGTGRLMDMAADQINAAREEAVTEISAFATRFAQEVAKQIVHIELDQGAHDVETIVRETLTRSGVGRGACVVHVNPADAESLEAVTFRSNTTIEADHGVARGCVQVTTPQGLLVRDVDLCIKHAAERIHDHMRQRAVAPAQESAETQGDA